MGLLTATIEKTLPPLYATEDVHADDKMVRLRLFALGSAATWLITEYDPGERVFFGYADLSGQGLAGGAEWGYIPLDELEALRFGPVPRVERDRFFTPARFADCITSDGRIK
jgi:hypothetical protein